MSEMTDVFNIVQGLEEGQSYKQPLEQSGSWPASTHMLDRKMLLAIAAALGAQKPILVRGAPGVGKSYFARAAAALLKRPFMSCVVQPHSDYQDLLWQVDFTQRLADAQACSGQDNRQDQLDLKKYISPGPLWYALDSQSARHYRNRSCYSPSEELLNSECDPVLLIDELDKADVNFANGLLEVLANGAFGVPYLAEPIGGVRSPLIIITSNSQRELPSAFLRRCIMLDLKLPDKDVQDYFISIGKAHFPELPGELLTQAAEIIIYDRAETQGSTVQTGLAEYVDLLRAVEAHSQESEMQRKSLQLLAPYFLKRAST